MGVVTSTPLLRWSSVRDCELKAVYEATGAPARDRTRAEENTLARGKDVGRGFVVRLANGQVTPWNVWVDSGPDFWLPPEFRATSEDSADAIAELRVQWELGIGHADLFVKETGTVLEILSSQNASADMVHSKLLQAAGYARALDAQSLALAIVNPVDYSEDRIIVTAGSPQWNDLMAEVDERIQVVQEWADNGTMPARVCVKPSDAYGHFCLHAAHCFDGFEPDPAEQIVSEEAQQLAIRLAHVKAKRRELSSADKLVEAEQKEIQEALAEFVPAGAFQVGGYLVKRSDRTRQSFKLALAQEDSRIPDWLLDEFTNVSQYSVWDVERTGPAVVIEDSAEDVPF